MSPVKALKALAILAPVALFPCQSFAWGIEFQDTYLSLRYLPEDKQPGYEKNANEVAGNISYANGWTYGSNFVSLDFEDFGHQDLANAVVGKQNSNSFELYSVFRTTLSGNKIFGGNQFSFGPHPRRRARVRPRHRHAGRPIRVLQEAGDLRARNSPSTCHAGSGPSPPA